jgi:hypothetical protein
MKKNIWHKKHSVKLYIGIFNNKKGSYFFRTWTRNCGVQNIINFSSKYNAQNYFYALHSVVNIQPRFMYCRSTRDMLAVILVCYRSSGSGSYAVTSPRQWLPDTVALLLRHGGGKGYLPSAVPFTSQYESICVLYKIKNTTCFRPADHLQVYEHQYTCPILMVQKHKSCNLWEYNVKNTCIRNRGTRGHI